MSGSLLEYAIAAFGEWEATQASPRDAVAKHLPRELAPAARAEVAAIVYGTIADQRRLGWLLGGEVDAMDGGIRSAALVLARIVVAGVLDAATAAQRWLQFSDQRLAFDELEFAATAAEAIAAIPDPIERFGVQHSLPDWLARQFRAEFGDDADAVAAALGQPPPRTIRCNRLRGGDRQALARELAEVGVSTALTRFAPDALHVTDDAALFELDAFATGRFEQQDEGSQLVALAVAPPPRGRVLDGCAGSGGKTLALAAMLANTGSVLAVDVHRGRIEALRLRARRAGAHNVQAVALPDGAWPDEVAKFAAGADRILLDVPCSGTGSWRRRPEARWSAQPTDLDALVALQRDLIDRAVSGLQPGARLVYATCSLWRAENEDQVQQALVRHPTLECVRLAEVLGGKVAGPIADAGGRYLSLRPDRHGTDGFFAAILRRRRPA